MSTLRLVVLWILCVSWVVWGCSTHSSPPDQVEDGAGEHLSSGDGGVDVALSDGWAPDLLEVHTAKDSNEVLADGPGTDADGDSTLPYPDEVPPAGVVMTLAPEVSLPFPWNGFLVDDATSRTGKRVALDGPMGMPATLRGVADMFAGATLELTSMGGFGALGMIAIPLASPLDGELLPVATDLTDRVGVFAVTADGLVEIPCQMEYQDCSEDADLHLLILHPRVPLKERTRYLVLVTREFEDADGLPFAPFPLAEVLLGVREPFGAPQEQVALAAARDETLAALARFEEPPDLSSLAAAWVFDVDVMESDLFQAARTIDDIAAKFDFDPDGDGNPNISVAGENGTPSGPGMAGFAQGRFRVPNFRNADGIMTYGDDGRLVVQDYQWRDFWLMIPAAMAEGKVPIAFVQHGLNSWKETMYGLGKEFVARGYVAAGFDFLHHGKGVDGGWDFVVIEKLLATRDNFRQCALDYYAFIQAFKALSGGGVMPILPGPVPEGGIDFSRVVITGHSLGAIESALAAPLYEGEALVGLLNAGANLQYLMVGFLKETGLYDLAPCDMVHGLRVVASHVLSPMDPGIVAPYMYQSPPPGVPKKPYLLEIGLKDGTVYWETGYDLARALGSPLLDPCEVCWDYLDVVPAASTSVGTVQFDGDHNFFFGGDGAELQAAARAIYFHFFDTGLATGNPELLWPATEAP
jgi:hypothetical protein